MDVNTAGVVARVKAYVMPINVSYNLLLSRRWTTRVKAIEDHEQNTIDIEGKDGVRRTITGTPGSAQMAGFDVCINAAENAKSLEDEDDNAEEAVENLLDELDHWVDNGEPAGNGERLR